MAPILKCRAAAVLNVFANRPAACRLRRKKLRPIGYHRSVRIGFKLPFASVALPPAPLAGCIRAYISKDTTQRVTERPQVNRYPASVYCGLAWFLEGSSERLDSDLRPLQRLPSTLILGPQTRPLVTRNPGPVRTFGVVFHPHAFHELTGLDISTLVDSLVPAHEVLPPAWLPLCDAVRTAPTDEERMALVEDFVAGLLPERLRPAAGTTGAAAAVRWMRELQAHAAASGLGSSLRSLERHVRTWAGQPLRRLGWLSRAEATLVQARELGESSGQAPRWHEVALEAGYADQAHLCRETQRVTGQSPTELARGVQGEDDSYWLYRLWK